MSIREIVYPFERIMCLFLYSKRKGLASYLYLALLFGRATNV